MQLRSVPIHHMFDDFRCHLQTQTSFLEGADPGRIDILRLDNLGTEFPALMGTYGLPQSPLPRVNVHRGGQRQLPETVVRWGVETYAEDFENFGYSRPNVTIAAAA